MTTIKSYTDLEQSRKLAKILPLESADMHYCLDPTPAGNIYHIVIPQIDFGIKTREPEYNKGDIPCWSLAALLGILPILDNKHAVFGTSIKESKWHIIYHNIDTLFLEDSGLYNNPVDACVAMIEKLNELDLL